MVKYMSEHTPHPGIIQVPYEVLVEILPYVPGTYLLKLCQTNRRLEIACSNSDLWLAKLAQDFPTADIDQHDPREVYKTLLHKVYAKWLQPYADWPTSLGYIALTYDPSPPFEIGRIGSTDRYDYEPLVWIGRASYYPNIQPNRKGRYIIVRRQRGQQSIEHLVSMGEYQHLTEDEADRTIGDLTERHHYTAIIISNLNDRLPWLEQLGLVQTIDLVR